MEFKQKTFGVWGKTFGLWGKTFGLWAKTSNFHQKLFRPSAEIFQQSCQKCNVGVQKVKLRFFKFERFQEISRNCQTSSETFPDHLQKKFWQGSQNCISCVQRIVLGIFWKKNDAFFPFSFGFRVKLFQTLGKKGSQNRTGFSKLPSTCPEGVFLKKNYIHIFFGFWAKKIVFSKLCRDCQNCTLGVHGNFLGFEKKREHVHSEVVNSGGKNQHTEGKISFSYYITTENTWRGKLAFYQLFPLHFR